MTKKGYKQTEEHRDRQCSSRSGMKRSVESIEKMSNSHKGKPSNRKGKPSPMKGIPRSPEIKLKISASMLGKKFSPEHCEHIRLSQLGRVPWCKGLHPQNLGGSNHYNWQGGISFLPYCSKFNKELKEAVRDRDNRTCQLCNEKENEEKLSVHHIHYDKENCNPDLISLCRVCNTKVNFNKEYYEQLFMNNLNNRALLYWSKRSEMS